MEEDHSSVDADDSGRPSRIGVSVEVLPPGFLADKDGPDPLKVVEGTEPHSEEEEEDEVDEHPTISLALGPVPPVPIDGEGSSPASPAGYGGKSSPFDVSVEVKEELPVRHVEEKDSVVEDAELGVSVEVGSERDSISREMVRPEPAAREANVEAVKEESERASGEALEPIEPDSPTEGSPKDDASPVVEAKEEPVESPVASPDEPEGSPQVESPLDAPYSPKVEELVSPVEAAPEPSPPQSPIAAPSIVVEPPKVVEEPPKVVVEPPKVIVEPPKVVESPKAPEPVVHAAPEKVKKIDAHALGAPLGDIREGSTSRPEASASKPAESKSADVKEEEDNEVEGDEEAPGGVEIEKDDPLNKTGGVKGIKLMMETGTIGEDEIKPRAKASSIAKLKSAGLVGRLKGQAEDLAKPKEEPKPVAKPSTAGVRKFPKVESEPPKEIPKTKPTVVARPEAESALGEDEIPDPGADVHRDAASSVQKLATKSIVSEKLKDPGHITPLVIGMPGAVNPLAGKKKGFKGADGGAEPVAMDGTGAFKVLPMAPDKDFSKKKLTSGESGTVDSKAESKIDSKKIDETSKENEASKPSVKAVEPVVPASPKSESEDSDIAEFKEKDKDKEKKIESKSSAKPQETIKEEPKPAPQPEAAKDLKKLKVDDDDAAPKKPGGCCIVM